MTIRKVLVVLAAFAIIVAACGDDGGGDDTTTAPPTTMDDVAEWPEKIVVGFIPSERQETLQDDIQPFMDALADRLGIEVEGIVTTDYNGLVVAMGTGSVDFGAFGPFGYVQAKEQYPTLEVLIQSVRFGSPTYHGQWYTNDASICDGTPVVGALENENGDTVLKEPKDVIALQVGWVPGDDATNSAPETLDDGTAVDPGLACEADLEKVRGKRIAFTSSTSTSGAVFPQLQLLNLGFDLENDIEFSYLESHDNAIAAVYNGDFDIGLSYDDARRTLRKTNPDVGSKLVVFNITSEIPNDVVAVRGELPDDLKQAFFDAVADYLSTDEGEAILDEIYGWTSIQTAAEADFDVVREAAEKLGITED